MHGADATRCSEGGKLSRSEGGGGGGGSDAVWGKMVTVTVTSCGRVWLLDKTLRSFLAANDYVFIHEIVIVEDSGDAAVCNGFLSPFSPLSSLSPRLLTPLSLSPSPHSSPSREMFSLMLFLQAGLPTLSELTKCVECTLPVAKGLKKLAGKPSKATIAAVLDSLKKCMNKLEDVADKCENPAVMVISSINSIGPVVALACSMASSMVEK